MTTGIADNEQKSAAVAALIVRRAVAGRGGLGRVLDVGCGTGTVLAAAKRASSSLDGVDVRAEFLARAAVALPEARFQNAAVERLPFAGASFDTAFFCDVIEHLHDPFAALCEIERVLAPGGMLVVTTPNSNAALRYVLGSAWPGLSDPTHVLFFTRFSLRHALRVTGFEAYADGTLGGSPVALVNRALEMFGNGGTLVAVSKKP